MPSQLHYAYNKADAIEKKCKCVGVVQGCVFFRIFAATKVNTCFVTHKCNFV